MFMPNHTRLTARHQAYSNVIFLMFLHGMQRMGAQVELLNAHTIEDVVTSTGDNTLHPELPRET